MAERFVVISGCSGGGKSSLLAELRRRGYDAVEEPGRRIFREEVESGGRALPWVDVEAFATRAIELAIADRVKAHACAEWTFFDRSVVDGACALEHATGEPALEMLGQTYRYHPTVFFAAPWPEIYVSDLERRHDFNAAKAEADRLSEAYTSLGYRIVLLPKTDVSQRASFVLSHLKVSSA